MTNTITMADGREIPVTDVPTETDAIATRITVSGSEKRSLDQYENHEAYHSIRLVLWPALRLGTVEANQRIQKLADVARDTVDDHIERTIEARREAFQQEREEWRSD